MLAARRLTGVVLLLLLSASGAHAQTFTLAADQFVLNTGPCVERSGAGTPEGSITGVVCDRWLNTTSGQLYFKLSGSGNTGWVTWTNANTNSAIVSRSSGGAVSVGALDATSVTDSGLTPTYVVFAGAGGILSGDADMTFATDALTVTKVLAPTYMYTPLMLAPANFTLQPMGDVYLDPLGNDVFPGRNYIINLGAINQKYLTLHAAELWVETLVAQNTIATIGGRVLVGPTTVQVADLAPATTAITVKHNQIANGDRIYMEADGKIEFMAVTSGASGGPGNYSYSVTRDLDGTGANQWYAGDAVFNTGTTGKGFIDLYSLSGVLSGSGPTIVGNVRTGTTYNNIEPRWAIGNLNGLFGYASELYGAAFGVPTGPWLKIDSTNGIRIGHNTTTFTQIDASGNASFTGTVTAALGAIGGWLIDATTIYSAAGTVGLTSVVTGGDDIRFYAGHTTPSSAPFSVTEAGALKATAGAIGGYTITATRLSDASGNMYMDSTNSGSSSDVRLNIGDSDHFRVYRDGSASIPTIISPVTIGDYLTVIGTIDSPRVGINVAPTAGYRLYVESGVSETALLAAAHTDGFIGVYGYHDRNTATGYVAYFQNATAGNGQYLTNTGNWIAISDRRMKTDIRALDVLDQLRLVIPRDFLWTSQAESDQPTRRNFGFIAQEVAEVFPGLVTTSPNGMFGVNYEGFIAPLVQGWQSHDTRLDALEARMKELTK